MLKRELYSALSDFISKNEKNKNVLIVQGARQVGKTFLVESYLKDLGDRQRQVSFNLEKNPLLKNEINESQDFAQFSQVIKKYGYTPLPGSLLFIDEAQESPKLGAYVRFMKEEWEDVSIILSGSSISKLFSGDARVPVGRVEYLRVTPLTFSEFVSASNKADLLHEAHEKLGAISDYIHQELITTYDAYLKVGGLPAIVLKHLSKEPQDALDRTRMEIYLSQEDDFYRKEKNIKSHLFRDGTKAIADLLGLPFSLTRISQNHRDAKVTLETLCEWLIAYKCEQESFSPTTEARPKIYLYDVGLANQLRSASIPNVSLSKTKDPMLRTILGGLVENAIFLEMQQGKGFLNQIAGWRKSAGDSVEVDFVVKANNQAIPIEVKCSEKFDQRRLQGLKLYLDLTKQNLGVLISTAKFQRYSFNNQQIVNLPVYLTSSFNSLEFGLGAS